MISKLYLNPNRTVNMKNLGIFSFFKQWFALGTKLYNNYETFKKKNPELVEKLEAEIKKQAKKQL